MTDAGLGELIAVCQRVENECLVTAKEEQEEEEGDEFLALKKRMYETIRNTQILIEDRRAIRAAKGAYGPGPGESGTFVQSLRCVESCSDTRPGTQRMQSISVVREPSRCLLFSSRHSRRYLPRSFPAAQEETWACRLRVLIVVKE